MRRRDFLRSTGLVTTSLLLPRFLQGMGGTRPVNARKLVVVQLTGGNDGLNTVVPYRNDVYYSTRPKLAIARELALPITDELGFNPGMTALRRLYDAGQVAIINGVGYPQPDRSHFRSMDIWQTASGSGQFLETGWLGRYMDAQNADPHDVVEFGGTLSLANKGDKVKAIAINDPGRFYQATREPYFARLASQQHALQHQQLGYLYRTMTETYRSAGYIQEHLRPRTTATTFPKGDFAKQLRHVSAFIQSGMETTVYYTSTAGFDTHVNQSGRHQKLLAEMSDGIAAFMDDIQAAGRSSEVLVMVFSEFGRRVKENASNGTDHGTASTMFLIGEGVKKAGVFNHLPSLETLDDNGDLKFSVDFRRLYATVLDRWLGSDPLNVLGARFETLPILG
jgi:uncharacterized protein (DUF1501 family)